MKWHITQFQLDQLDEKENRLAKSYFRTQDSEGKPAYGAEFWDIGRMCDFLYSKAIQNILSLPPSERGLVDIYGLNMSATLKEQWCDKLWEKVRRVLIEEVRENSHLFW